MNTKNTIVCETRTPQDNKRYFKDVCSLKIKNPDKIHNGDRIKNHPTTIEIDCKSFVEIDWCYLTRSRERERFPNQGERFDELILFDTMTRRKSIVNCVVVDLLINANGLHVLLETCN